MVRSSRTSHKTRSVAVALGATAILAASFVGASAQSPSAAAGGTGSIWVLLPDSASSPRWEADDRRYFEEAFTTAGVPHTIVNAENSATTQQQQAEQAIAEGAKVILLVNLDSDSAATMISEAHAAGVKVVDYDRLTISGPGADAYVSFDNVEVGRTMASVLEPVINALADSPKQVVMLNGAPTDNNATLFRQGYDETVQKHVTDGSWAVVADQAVDKWDGTIAQTLFEQIYTNAGGKIDAVFAANDNLANSVISVLKTEGHGPVPLSGQDASVVGIQHILAGDQTMTVYKPIQAEAEAAAKVALALYAGQDLSTLTNGATINNGTNDIPFVSLTPVGVTKDNVADTVIKDGFRSWADICVGDFAQYCPPDALGSAAPASTAP